MRPDPDHEAVLASTACHRVLVAPPGTGKTFLAVRVAAKMAPSLSAGSRVLLLTFSNQARIQLEREAERQLGPETRKRVEVSNYHRLFWRCVRSYRRALGLPMQLDIGSRARREAVIRREAPDALSSLKQHEGLLETIAEHQFPEFKDERTPAEAELSRILRIVDAEQRRGRLVFDDLGALFWRLLNQYPSVAEAYRDRFPIVIADEHQDASALQDAVVRRLARDSLLVMADPMQLIYGFRGASPDRIERHLREGASFELRTPHRWHGSPPVARWLLGVRARLRGQAVSVPKPREVEICRTDAARGFSGTKSAVRFAVLRAFEKHESSVVVLSRSNRDASDLRRYLSVQGLRPRQVGADDFEEGREDIEQLPLLGDAQSVARHLVTRVRSLVPTIKESVISQAVGRISAEGVQLRGAGQAASILLRNVAPIFERGAAAYVSSLSAAVDELERAGHHLPRPLAVRALRAAAGNAACGSGDVEAALAAYAAEVAEATHAAPRDIRGLHVMTVHQSKGKEFDAVVLANVSRFSFPDDDESRRLLYVGVTRAKRFWTIVAPDRDASPLLQAVTG